MISTTMYISAINTIVRETPFRDKTIREDILCGTKFGEYFFRAN